MLGRWLRERRRRRILEGPFPAQWLPWVEHHVPQWKQLDEDERRSLLRRVRLFVAEQTWEPCGGFRMTDEVKVAIAGHASLLILALAEDLFREVSSILVYPGTVVRPAHAGSLGSGGLEIVEPPDPIVGEAALRGPVLLSWDAVRRAGGRSAAETNVVHHEFAHQIDMLDGVVDGTPPLPGREERERWAEVCTRELAQLRQAAARGRRTLLDPYGATDEGEFFAVATECFFAQPMRLEARHAELYGLLERSFGQDPAARERRYRSRLP